MEDPDSAGKIADAAKEVAKTTGKAIDVLRDTGGFFNRVFGGLIEDGVGLVADRLKYYRKERAVLLAEKVERILTERRVLATKAVPVSIAVPLLENATLEDDDDLHDLWARLLANSMDPRGPRVDRSFISILSEMTAHDALLLKRANDRASGFFSSDDTVVRTEDLMDRSVFFSFRDERDEVSLFNLLRLGVIFPSYMENTKKHIEDKKRKEADGGGLFGNDRETNAEDEIVAIRISPLGRAFLKAVRK